MTNDDFLMDEKNYENGIPTFRAEEPPGQPPPIESNADKNNTDESFTISKQVGNNTYEQVRNPNYRPPGPRPTDDMLDLFEKRTAYETKVKEQLPDLDIDVVRIAERDTLSELYRDKSYLLYGRQTKEDESRYQAILNRNMQLAMQKQSYARKLYDGAMNLFDEDVKTRRKHEGDIAVEQAKAGIKMPSEDQRINNAFSSQYGRPPTDQEFLDAKALHQAKSAGVKTAAIEQQRGGQFGEGTLNYMVQKYETDGVVPAFGMGGVGAKQRAKFFDKVAERALQRGDTGGAQAIRGMEFKSNQSALTDLTKREQLINSFKVRIDETSDKVLIPLIKKWDLQNPRFANWPINKLAQFIGSGDLASLKLALNSVSVEVGKVEFNALGIQQLSDSAAKFIKEVHDESLKVSELLKVIDTSKALGETGLDAISEQRKSLVERTRQIAPQQSQPTKRTIKLKSGKIIEVED